MRVFGHREVRRWVLERAQVRLSVKPQGLPSLYAVITECFLDVLNNVITGSGIKGGHITNVF